MTRRPITDRGTAKTTRLRKLACPCGYSVRVSRAMIARGLPGCPCGAGQLVPAALEDALLAHEHGHLSADALAEHPEHDQWQRELNSITRGQRAAVQRSRATQQPEDLAWRRILKDRRAQADASKLTALRTYNPLVPFVEDEPIPF